MHVIETKRLILREWQESDAPGKVMMNCGVDDTWCDTLCPKLEIGGDKPVRVMRLEYALCF